MKRLAVLLCAVTLIIGVVSTAMAVPITGELSIVGLFEPTGDTKLGDASGISFPSSLAVAGSTGDLSGALGQTVALSAFSFSPFAASVEPLWAIPATGPTVYSFDLIDLDIVAQNTTCLNLYGAGTLHVIGFDDTPGVWTFTGTTAGNTLLSFWDL